MKEKENLIKSMISYGTYMKWTDEEIIEHLMELGITKKDFIMLDYFKEQFPIYVA